MVGIIIYSILYNWGSLNQTPLLQGVGTITETTKQVSTWDARFIITFIAVAGIFGIYKLIIYIHRDKIKENELLRNQIKEILTHDNKEVVRLEKELRRCRAAFKKCRQENNDLKDEMIIYITKAVEKRRGE